MPNWRFARSAVSAVRSAMTPTSIIYHIDSPATTEVGSTRLTPFQGWAVSARGKPVELRVRVAGRLWREFALDQSRPDVADYFGERFPDLDPDCGFSFCIDLDEHDFDTVLPVTLEFRAGGSRVRSATYQLRPCVSPSLVRAHYKEVWNACAANERDAMLHVAGYSDEAEFQRVGELTRDMLVECVGVRPDDVVLEIGAGIGRVGQFLAPVCKEWIGADVSENMLGHLGKRLAGFPNVRTIALNGYDLGPVPDASVDLVYCTVVFMHLDEWERFNYVREGFRVLRPGGRMLVDNTNLLSEEGWAFFLKTMDLYHPLGRPASISKSSTPQELRTYFERAGFADIRQKTSGPWIITFGRK
jgi:SAM-dependent methyltransferase